MVAFGTPNGSILELSSKPENKYVKMLDIVKKIHYYKFEIKFNPKNK